VIVCFFDIEPTGTYYNKSTDVVYLKFKDTPELRQTEANFILVMQPSMQGSGSMPREEFAVIKSARRSEVYDDK